MSSVFDDVIAIAKSQADAYHAAYQTGYAEGYRIAMAEARKLVTESFAKPDEPKVTP